MCYRNIHVKAIIVYLPIPSFFSMTVCMSAGAISEFSGRLRYDPKEKSSRLPVKESNPNFDEGMPGRR